MSQWKVEHLQDKAMLRLHINGEVIDMPDVDTMIDFVAVASLSPLTPWRLTVDEALRLGAEIERASNEAHR